jgi:hypothetical protein
MTKARSNPIAAREEILTKSKESSRYFQSFLFMGNPLGYTCILGRCFYSICLVRLRDISSENIFPHPYLLFLKWDSRWDFIDLFRVGSLFLE